MNKKRIQTVKIIIFVLAVLVLCLVGEYLYEYFTRDFADISFFAKYFSLGLALILIGCIAFCLPFFTRTRYGDNKGDNTMLIVAILLVLCGIVSIPLSFLWFK
ncbi:MAG: hypothetical protein IJM36_03135 [Acholeplasmatales bacterium]|nr:hypothetical protein [Acholeplasmatales bacterium]